MALGLVVVVNLLVVGAGLAWLGASGRISTERVRAVAAIFEDPVAADEARRADEAEQAAAQEAEQAEAEHIERVAAGHESIDEQLDRTKRSDDAARLQLERKDREAQALRQQIEMAREAVAREREALAAERAEFEAAMKRETELRGDEDFQQAVAMVEALKGKQAKELFDSLIAQGKREEVIDYLAAMQLRKAAAVLKEFKGPGEAAVAAGLLEAVRLRNADPLGSTPPTAPTAPTGPTTPGGDGLFGSSPTLPPPTPEHSDDRSAALR